MGKIREYAQLVEFTGSETFIVETDEGTRTVNYEQLVALIKEKHDEYIGDDVAEAIISAVLDGKITLANMGITLGTAKTIAIDDDAIDLGADNVQDALQFQKRRIDEIAKLPEGSTTADAELVDIRNTYDGMTYPTAGIAMRMQFAESHDEVEQISEINSTLGERKKSINKEYGKTIQCFFVDEAGTIYCEDTASTLCIPCKPNTQYSIEKKIDKIFRICYTKVIPDDGVNVYNVVNINESEEIDTVNYTTGADAMYICIYYFNERVSMDTKSNLYESIVITQTIENRTARDTIARKDIEKIQQKIDELQETINNLIEALAP